MADATVEGGDVDVQGTVAIITGGKPIGQVVARELARRGADIMLGCRGSGPRPIRRPATSSPWPTRADARGRRLAGGRLRVADRGGGRGPRARGHPRQHGLHLRLDSVRCDDGGHLEQGPRRQSDVGVPVREGRRPAHAPCRRRTHRQFRRLAGSERTPVLSRVRLVLRCQRGHHRPHGSSGAGARRRPNPGERHRPGPILRPPDLPTTRSRKSQRRRRPGVGAAKSRRSEGRGGSRRGDHAGGRRAMAIQANLSSVSAVRGWSPPPRRWAASTSW